MFDEMSVVASVRLMACSDSDLRPLSNNQSPLSLNVMNGTSKNGLPRLGQNGTPKRKPLPRRLRPLEHPTRIPVLRRSKTKNKKQRKLRSNSSIAESTLDNSRIECIVLDAELHTSTPKVQQTRALEPEQDRSDSSGAESDCEIIENVTPLIVLDDDGLDEPKRSNSETAHSSTNTSSINISESSNVQSSEILNESESNVELNSEPDRPPDPDPEPEPEPEPVPLFFIDKNPGVDFEAPIYEVKEPETMSARARNIRITGPVKFTNKENEVSDETVFIPNPQLSSTRLNDSIDENGNTPSNSMVTDTNLHISINSTCESRTVTMTGSQKSEQALSNIGNTNTIEASRPNKRKSQKQTPDEPPVKKTNTSDVIVLNDTISDTEEDSIVFVSETIEKRNRSAILDRVNKNKALDYIALGNGSNNREKPQSTRAKRRMEKKLVSKAKPINAKTKQQQQQNGGKNKRANRFDVRNPSTSFETYSSVVSKGTSTVTSKSPESKRSAQRNLKIQYEKELKLFKEKPELFEKRMIIIDGSNVARTHGVKDNSFSVKGIEVCMKYFEDQGFEVKAVVPQFRKKRSQSTDPDKLESMERADKLIVTPCKNLPGIRSTSYDDRFILDAAVEFDAAIISNDNYADLLDEKQEYADIIKERVVGFSFCNNFIMIPQDPYGRNGRTLQLILNRLKSDANVDLNNTTK